MKKLLLSVFAFASAIIANAQCTDLIISEYVDGSGNDKALEIYNPTNTTINLSGYTIERYSNGGSTSLAGGVLNLSGTIQADSVLVIVNGQTTVEQGGTSPACSPALQAMADILDGPYPAPTYMNGDDAIVLLKNGNIVDIIGKIGEDPGVSWTSTFPYNNGLGAWLTKDHTLQRKSTVQTGVSTNPTTFNALAEWDTLPKNTWTGLGEHNCDCHSVGIYESDNSVSIQVFPNPSNSNFIYVNSSELIEKVELYNLLGERILEKNVNNNSKNTHIETSSIAKGVYFVKASFDKNKITTVKLIIP